MASSGEKESLSPRVLRAMAAILVIVALGLAIVGWNLGSKGEPSKETLHKSRRSCLCASGGVESDLPATV